MNPSSIHEDAGLILGHHLVSCGVGHRYGLDLAMLLLWCRLAATAQIRLLAWEPPYAMGTALKSKKKKN